MEYTFTEKEFKKLKQLAEDTANKAEVLLCYLACNEDNLEIYIMSSLFKDIRKCIGDISWEFIKKEDYSDEED